MGVFKILAGVAVGVGAVAAAPFTGGGSLLGGATLLGSLAGAGAVAAATGAAVAGGAAGYALSQEEKAKQEQKIRNAKEEGFEAGKLLATEQYEAKITQLHNRLQSYDNFAKNIVGLFAVGLAVANIDGHISIEEQDDLETFITGISGAHFPKDLLSEINRLRYNTPTFEIAMDLAKKYNCRREDIDDVIELIANSDGYIAQSEIEFMNRWKEYSSRNYLQ